MDSPLVDVELTNRMTRLLLLFVGYINHGRFRPAQVDNVVYGNHQMPHSILHSISSVVYSTNQTLKSPTMEIIEAMIDRACSRVGTTPYDRR